MLMKKLFFKNRGQSLIELAIFSSVILLAMTVLVSYAMTYNDNQRLGMMGFRRTMKLAGEVSKTSLNASVVLIYDKAIADIRSMFGIADRAPVSFSSSGVISNELYSEMEGLDEELSRVVYDINGKVYKFKTAAFRDICSGPKAETKQCVEGYKALAKRKAFIEGWDGTGQSWQLEYPDDDENKFDTNTSWDIDDDGEEEVILKLTETVRELVDPDGPGLGQQPYWREVERDKWAVMDNQDGELNMGEADIEKINGLLPDTAITRLNNSAITNIQQNQTFSTATRIDYAEGIDRFIRLNPNFNGSMEEIFVQIRDNNPGCSYGGNFSCGVNLYEQMKNQVPVDSYGRGENLPGYCDCVIEDGNQKYIVVRSLFINRGNAFNWQRSQNE